MIGSIYFAVRRPFQTDLAKRKLIPQYAGREYWFRNAQAAGSDFAVHKRSILELCALRNRMSHHTPAYFEINSQPRHCEIKSRITPLRAFGCETYFVCTSCAGLLDPRSRLRELISQCGWDKFVLAFHRSMAMRDMIYLLPTRAQLIEY